MLFKPMDEAKILELIKDHEDVLTPMVKADQQVYEAQSCPTCGSGMIVEPDVNRMLNNNRPIPKHLVRCPVCTHLMDPFSGLTLETGDKSLLEPAVPLIHNED